MSGIKKIDFFVGVFLTSILASAKNVPALFTDEKVESKRLEFESNKGLFNIYVKYSTTRKESFFDKKRQKKLYYCNFTIQEIEYEKIKRFPKSGYNNYIVLVWTNEGFSKTWIVVLDHEKVMRCLSNQTPTGSRKIKVMRIGGEHEFLCQGVGYQDDEFETCLYDYSKYFEDTKHLGKKPIQEPSLMVVNE